MIKYFETWKILSLADSERETIVFCNKYTLKIFFRRKSTKKVFLHTNCMYVLVLLFVPQQDLWLWCLYFLVSFTDIEIYTQKNSI